MIPALSIRHLDIGYGKDPVLRDLSLSLSPGEVTALIGRNGSGKSTLIKTLTGNLRSLGGEISIGEKELGKFSRKELARTFAVVTTENHTGGGLRLEEMVSLGRIPYSGMTGILSRVDRELISEALEAVGLTPLKRKFVSELSDGERQKGMIARGLAQQTPILIMDEPFSFLDVASRLELMILLRKLAREKRKAILFSTHEVGEALRMADKIWMIVRNGKDAHNELIEGAPEELIEKGYVKYLFPDSRVEFDGNNFFIKDE